MTQRIPARGAKNNKFYSILKIVPGFPLFGFFSGVKKCLHIVKVYCNNCIEWSVGRNGKVLAKHVKNLPKPSGLEQWSGVRLEMKYAGNPSITIIQTSHKLRIWRKQLFINNVVIFGSFPLSWHFSFYTFHFAFFLTLSLPLLHCAPVSWHSIPMSDWAFVQLLLLGARWSTQSLFSTRDRSP